MSTIRYLSTLAAVALASLILTPASAQFPVPAPRTCGSGVAEAGEECDPALRPERLDTRGKTLENRPAVGRDAFGLAGSQSQIGSNVGHGSSVPPPGAPVRGTGIVAGSCIVRTVARNRTMPVRLGELPSSYLP